MLPLADLTAHLEKDDIVIDGGNSYYIDDIRRAKRTGKIRNPLCGRGNQRRRLGKRAWLLPDDWWFKVSSGAPRSNIPYPRTRYEVRPS